MAGRAGGNGKQIFGDAWWLETDAVPFPGAAGDSSFAQLSDALFPPAALAKAGKARTNTTGASPRLQRSAPMHLRPAGVTPAWGRRQAAPTRR